MERRLDALLRQQRYAIQHMHDLARSDGNTRSMNHMVEDNPATRSVNLVIPTDAIKIEAGLFGESESGDDGRSAGGGVARSESSTRATNSQHSASIHKQSSNKDLRRKNLSVNVFLTHFYQIPSYHCDNVCQMAFLFFIFFCSSFSLLSFF
jgi:hypothetical protein